MFDVSNASSLRALRGLNTLVFSSGKMVGSNVDAFGAESLKEIFFYGSHISATTWSSISTKLRTNRSIKTFVITEGKLGRSGSIESSAADTFRFIATNTSLTALKLNCEIPGSGATALSESLAQNKTLNFLMFRCPDESIAALAHMIETPHPALRHLSMVLSAITEDAIRKMRKKDKSLKKKAIQTQDAIMKKDAILSLLMALQRNRSLETLELRFARRLSRVALSCPDWKKRLQEALVALANANHTIKKLHFAIGCTIDTSMLKVKRDVRIDLRHTESDTVWVAGLAEFHQWGDLAGIHALVRACPGYLLHHGGISSGTTRPTKRAKTDGSDDG